MLDRAVVDALFPSDLPEPSFWEEQYPPRGLAEGAKVVRLGPSPTGFLHIGGLYVGSIDRDIATHSGGSYIVRVEDTDQAREVPGAVEQFNKAFAYFGIQPDEADSVGAYGPYHQSQREQIYLTYVRELLRTGHAYLCFATKEELADITARQQATKLPTGYYGRWAIWRDKTAEDVQAALDEGRPYVVRFRSPGKPGERTSFVDAIRGTLEHEANRNDVVILKASDQSPRLPTYHFAHAVDDHLMRVNLVIRGEEWISSVPTHLQLFDALGFDRVEYAHIAPLMKQQGGSRRKLSKRKDPEASVEYFIEAGFPAEAVQYYLRGLVNARLAELPLAEALESPINLAECGVAGPLVDLVKLDDICADYVATLSGEEIIDRVSTWAASYDPELVTVLSEERDVALAALKVERGPEVANPRKDLRKWSDFRTAYGFFFPSLFPLVSDKADERLGGLPPELIAAFTADFADGYADLEDGQEWFGQIRELAAKHGFAPNPKELKKNPDAYPGSIREAAQLIRVALTGSKASPDLHAVARTLGTDEVLRRVRALAG
ncbi:glutamate--tRNA ligase family protein [Lentzea sp. NBRC 102530]|uniref:glutamate--tRNA ligase n=1 Tax=Lentzea sp. NBRC 102530 TaxID=3032201 RepID=UPI0024A58A08|nr:glutamate--tRNA ligase family protein [Lentzea sp. NBRC 102530]GLY52950.1 glutamate--tRNA ligase [Lentzea sp. NBRC 102530]